MLIPTRVFPVLLATALATQAQEPVIVSLKDAVAKEVQAQGFTLPRDQKVHVYARGASDRRWDPSPLFAYGWILNAATREVVWQMDVRACRWQDGYQVADQYLDLPKGSYEAYFANATYEGRTFFVQWSRNVDRRALGADLRGRGFFERLHREGLDRWRREAALYGMEIYAPGADPKDIARFDAPLRWRGEVVSLIANGDADHGSQTFRVKRPVSLHVYAQGERMGDRPFADTGWIMDLRTGKRVWQMDGAKAGYGGGSTKNRRQVETIQLPPGDYEATYVTDDSHSPADWNGAPPCDPLRYGLVLSVPDPAEAGAVVLADLKRSDLVLAEVVRVGDDEDRRASFTLKAPASVRVYALGEGSGDEMADFGWIEDAKGTKVWTQRFEDTVPAGGASKNRQSDAVLALPKGTYTLRYVTDGSHAYGHWNARAPRDPEHYGITVYAE